MQLTGYEPADLCNWKQLLYLSTVPKYIITSFFNRPLQAPFIYFRLFNTADSIQMYYIKVPPMTGFEPLTSGIRSDHSTNWATTTAYILLSEFLLNIFCSAESF